MPEAECAWSNRVTYISDVAVAGVGGWMEWGVVVILLLGKLLNKYF